MSDEGDEVRRAADEFADVTESAVKRFRVRALWVGGVLLLVLIGLSVPYVLRARDQAQRSSCVCNHMGIAMSLTQYAQDCDEQYPRALVDESEPAQHRFARLLKVGPVSYTHLRAHET